MKGFDEPVQAYRVLRRERCREPLRGAARRGRRLTPLVGREEEIELLLRRWRQARDGEGRVVLLSGEAGHRQVADRRAIQERLAGEPHTRLLLLLLAAPPRQRPPPVHQAARARGRLRARRRAPNASSTSWRRCSRRRAGMSRATRPLLAELLSIPSGGRYPPRPDLSPQKRKEETLAALLAQLDGLAARRPVLMVFEDAHWIDPTSLELLERIDRSGARACRCC